MLNETNVFEGAGGNDWAYKGAHRPRLRIEARLYLLDFGNSEKT
jgi:hypothetical protein